MCVPGFFFVLLLLRSDLRLRGGVNPVGFEPSCGQGGEILNLQLRYFGWNSCFLQDGIGGVPTANLVRNGY